MGFADVLRLRGNASAHLFPQEREDIQSGALTQVGWCPLECWCLGSKNLSVEGAAGRDRRAHRSPGRV